MLKFTPAAKDAASAGQPNSALRAQLPLSKALCINNRMKYLLIALVVLCSLLGGYWYGYAVGFTESRMLAIGGNAIDEMRAVEELEFNPNVNAKDLHESKITEALINYGKYIEKEEYIAIPLFYSAKPVIYSDLEKLIGYRKENPRIINGKVYSPFIENYEERESFKNLDPSSKKQYIQDEKYYKRVMGQ